MIKKKNIVVLYGGKSKERDVSLKTGKNIFEAIPEKEYNKILIDTKEDLNKLIRLIMKKEVSLVIIALHGDFGEDGKIQGFLETMQVPYVGSGVLSSAICIDKEKTKIILKHNKLLTPEWLVLKNKQDKINMKTPFVVKPVDNGSSFGVCIVRNKKEIKKAIDSCFKISNSVLIEKFIEGKELTVGIIGNKKPKALPIIEIIVRGKSSFFDYNAKYSGKTKEVVPAKIGKKLTQKIKNIALKAYSNLECRDIARVDIIMDKKNKVYVLEVNTIPGMTSESLLPKEAAAEGIKFNKLIGLLIKMGLKHG